MTESTLGPSRFHLAAMIAAARRRGRRRKFALAALGAVALIVGGGIWAGLSLSGGGGAGAAVHAPPGFHVVPAQGPVAHQVLELWAFHQPLSLDIGSGAARPVRTTREIWYDGRGNASRFVDRNDSRIQSDHAQTCPGPCFPGFSFQTYWPLNTSRYTRQPGIGTFHGRPVIWIAPLQPGGFAPYPGDGEQIGLDPLTHEPVADRTYSGGKIVSQAEVLERKPDIAAGDYAFVVPNPYPPLRKEPTAFSATGTDPFALRARRALGRTPLWLGERFHGNRLHRVTIGSTFDPPTGIQPAAAPLVTYDYGNVGITEFSSRVLYGPGQGGPVPGRMTLEESQTSTSSKPATIEGLELTRGGLFVIAGKSHPGSYVLDRAGALRLARALQPVPLR